MTPAARHSEAVVRCKASPNDVFALLDDPRLLGAHMSQRSWMMFGGAMTYDTDEGQGRKLGSHIRMSGSVAGMKIALDEIVTAYEPPHHKEWETVGAPRLIVIQSYTMGFDLTPVLVGQTHARIFIDYVPTQTWFGPFAALYAQWCVDRMAAVAKERFGAASG